jgi:hypothetical protein
MGMIGRHRRLTSRGLAMPLNLHPLTCHNVAMAGLWDEDNCCDSCHCLSENTDEPMGGPAIPVNGRGRESHFEFAVCCACSEALRARPEPYRDLAALVAWERHEYWRTWGEEGEDMAKLTDMIDASWARDTGLTAEVTVGRENGHRVRLGVAADWDFFDLGITYWGYGTCLTVGLGFVRVYIDYMHPYHPYVPEDTTPLPKETEVERLERERCAALREDICDGVYDLSLAALERIVAIIAAEEENDDRAHCLSE